MAAMNRYTVLPDQRVVNTHVAQDLSLINAALKTKQGAYDEAELFSQKTQDSFSQFATRDVDIARKNALTQEYVTQAQAVVEKYNGDYSQAMPALRKLSQGVAQNEFWQRAQSALTRQKDMQAVEKRIQEKGGNALKFNDDAYRKAVYNEDGSYNNIDYDVQEQLDYTKPKMELMKDIASDTRLQGIGAAGVAGVLQYGKAKGVDAGKVMAVAKQMITPYLQTPEGMQEVKWLRHQNPNISNEDIVRRVMSSLAGVGSKQIGVDRDMNYMGDPTYDKEGSKTKDTVSMSIEQTSPAVDVKTLAAGLAPDMFNRKNRAAAEAAPISGMMAGSTGIGATMRSGKADKNSYAPLDKTQREKAAAMLMESHPKEAKRLLSGNATEADMDVIAPHMRRQLKALGNMKVGASVRSIPSTNEYAGYGKGEIGYTKMLLGSDKLNDINSGKLIGATFYTPDGEKMSGTDFVNKVLIPAQQAAKAGKQDATARITGQFSAANPYSLLTNDDSFGDAKQLVIGDKQYVVAGLDEIKTHNVTRTMKNGETMSGSYQENISQQTKQVALPITKAMRNVGQTIPVTMGKGNVKLKWNTDGTFTFPELPDPNRGGAKGLTTDDPEKILRLFQ